MYFSVLFIIQHTTILKCKLNRFKIRQRTICLGVLAHLQLPGNSWELQCSPCCFSVLTVFLSDVTVVPACMPPPPVECAVSEAGT
jgi:hypothetical protein